MPKPLRVSLIGLGAVGQGIVSLVNSGHMAQIDIVGAIVRDPSRARSSAGVPTTRSMNELIALRPEVIVEVGGHEALRQHGPQALKAGCDLLLVSVGALADASFEAELTGLAASVRRRVTIASGAIGGLDALGAARMGGLSHVRHTIRKPPHALLDPSEAQGLVGPRELFRGSVREGASLFPESVNVAAAVSLAGLGFDRTELAVIADPHVTRNQHEIDAEGTFGSLRFEIRNVPNESNPRSTRLVAMSVVYQLLKRDAVLTIG